jgi:hypothetical protein
MKLVGTAALVTGLLMSPVMASANDFSTVARVQFVMDCMEAHPNMNVYESVHKCSCVVDEIAKVFTQREFEDLDAGYRYKNLPAERGGTFRDDEQLNTGWKLFKQTHAEAYQSCRMR